MNILLIESLDNIDFPENPILIPGKRGFANCTNVNTSIYDLSYVKDQQIQLVNVSEDPEMLMATTMDGQTGLIKRSHVEFYQDSHLLLLDFYHGYTRTETVLKLMHDAPPGSYLLRNSNLIHNALSLDIKCNCPEEIHHLRIVNENSFFYVHSVIFKDIGDIIKSTTYHPQEPEYRIKCEYPIPTKNSNRDYIVSKTLIKNRQYLRDTSVKIKQRIGGGQYGDVFVGKFNGIPVAIKSVKESSKEYTGDCFFADEVALMHELYHKNVVHFIGCIIENERIIKVVMEWCDRGDLHNFVKNFKLKPVHCLRLSLRIAEGLRYIHQKNIVHGDIAARNVLLTEELFPKITDFGLSSFEKKTIPQGTPVPFRWMSPEALEFSIIDLISDVWSFGVLMWEIYNEAKLPYPGWNGNKIHTMITTEDYRLSQSDICSDEAYSIMLDCWEIDIYNRKTISEICDDLNFALESYSQNKTKE